MKSTNKNSYEVALSVVLIAIIIYFLTKNSIWVKVGFLIGLASLVSERFTDLLALGWGKFLGAIGFVNSHILLSAVFFIVLLPLSFVYRLFNKDNLNLKAGKETYFSKRNKVYSAADLKNPW